MNKLEKIVLKELLDQAIEQLSNNSCNDFEVAVTDDTRKDAYRLIRAVTISDDEYKEVLLKEVKTADSIMLIDFVLLKHFRDKLCGDSEIE